MTLIFRPDHGPTLRFDTLSDFLVWKRQNLSAGTSVHGTSVNDGVREYGKLHDAVVTSDGYAFWRTRNDQWTDGDMTFDHCPTDDDDHYGTCPTCLDPIDYCLGHGDIA